MRTTMKLLVTTLTLALAITMAQGPRNGGGQANGQGDGNGNGQGKQSGQAQLDRSQIREISGDCTAVNITAGSRYPSIEIGGQTVRLGPSWFLLENDFEIAVGDELVVAAAPSLNAEDPYLYAVSIRNISTSKQIQLRAETGNEWSHRSGNGRNGEPAGNRQQIGGCGFIETGTVVGEVTEITMGIGLRQPNLVLAPEGSGEAMTIKLGPFRILDELGLVIEADDVITVSFGVTACTDETVAVEVTTADGTFLLRNPDGSPAW
jgi:hypothetical protein